MKNNVAMGRRAREAISEDMPVLIFSSGFVSTAGQFGTGRAVDAPSTTFVAKLISDARTNMVPIFFHGQQQCVSYRVPPLGVLAYGVSCS